MPLKKQLSVFVENKVGSIYELCTDLSKASINILGVLVSDDLDWGVIRLVVDDVEKAKQILKNSGFMYGESDIVVVYLDNHPGALAGVAEKLSKANIAIEYMYASGEGEKALVILATTNNKKADKIISGK